MATRSIHWYNVRYCLILGNTKKIKRERDVEEGRRKKRSKSHYNFLKNLIILIPLIFLYLRKNEIAIKIFTNQRNKQLHATNPLMYYENNVLNTDYMSKLWTEINKCEHTNQLIGYCTRKNAVVIKRFRHSVKTIRSIFCNPIFFVAEISGNRTILVYVTKSKKSA